MKNAHLYTLELNWTGDPAINKIKNDRLYEIKVPGKNSFKGSADPFFHGDKNLLNPEDLLLSALSACHMMSYFYVCRKNGIDIKSYQDSPEGILKVNLNGSGQFEKVTLKPLVTIKDKAHLEAANRLHAEASKLCFIANSCNFKIVVAPVIQAA